MDLGSSVRSPVNTSTSATSAVHDEYMITLHKEKSLGARLLRSGSYSAGVDNSAEVLIASSYVKQDTRVQEATVIRASKRGPASPIRVDYATCTVDPNAFTEMQGVRVLVGPIFS